MAASLFFPRGQAWIMILAATVCCALQFSAVLADHSPTKVAVAAAPAPLVVGVPAPAPAPKVLTLHEKVVAALRAAGHYGAISGLLDSLGDTNFIKEGVTLFAPDDAAFSGLNLNSSKLLMTTLNYHVATSVYNYNQLSNLPLNSTIQTSALNVFIFITSIGKNGLRLDNVVISDPDVYADGKVAVQGISSVMDTAKYNKGVVPPEASPTPLAGDPSPAPGLITTPTAPKTASPAGTGNDAAHVVSSMVSTVLLVVAISFVIALL